jgi:hypothetical protein
MNIDKSKHPLLTWAKGTIKSLSTIYVITVFNIAWQLGKKQIFISKEQRFSPFS